MQKQMLMLLTIQEELLFTHQLLPMPKVVFQILLSHRATNLNAKTYDGTTPLILAASVAIEGMVEELIQAEADINASDENGKSALHWAASLDYVDAVKTLLAHGAFRDAQVVKS